MLPRKLRNRYALAGVVLTWLVGGVIGLVGYRQMTAAVRDEAVARVEEAARMGQRVLEAQFTSLDPTRTLPRDAKLFSIPAEDVRQRTALYPLIRKARTDGKAEGFALLDEGLCMVSVRRSLVGERFLVALYPLRGAHWLPDQIRTVVFGSGGRGPESATVTIFEKDVRIATNVTLPDGRRATGTRASEAVARKVLGEGQTWNDRAPVVNRWMITSYQPIRSLDGEVIGMLYAGLDEAPYVAQGERNIVLSLAFILGLTLAISAGGWYLGKRLAHPLTKLTMASAALGRGGRERIAVSARDPEEVRLLAETFNQMADQIHAKAAALESSNLKAKKALDDYMEILGFVAHELKSPVAGALTQLATIEGGYAGEVPQPLRRPLAALRRSLEYGQEIALSFNNLSRAESEGFALKKRDLADFCQEIIRLAIADFSSQATQREMLIALQGAPIPLRADPDLMRVVMDNLIGNAVKYGQAGTEIRVCAQKLPDGVRVEVYNRGVGVPRERFPELFAKFRRIHDPKLRSRKGTGVGLYLVKKIVDLHGGRVGVEGEYGDWIRFWFEIPDGDASPLPAKSEEGTGASLPNSASQEGKTLASSAS
jgi:two-component system NtrC family sensor kinase